MNRSKGLSSNRNLRFLTIAAGLVLMICLFAEGAIAGDYDGIGGWSMKVKQKESSETGVPGGDQLIVDLESNAVGRPVAEETRQAPRPTLSEMALLRNWYWLLRLIVLR